MLLRHLYSNRAETSAELSERAHGRTLEYVTELQRGFCGRSHAEDHKWGDQLGYLQGQIRHHSHIRVRESKGREGNTHMGAEVRGQRRCQLLCRLGSREKGSLEAAPAARGGEKLPSLEPLGGRQLVLSLYLFILKC